MVGVAEWCAEAGIAPERAQPDVPGADERRGPCQATDVALTLVETGADGAGAALGGGDDGAAVEEPLVANLFDAGCAAGVDGRLRWRGGNLE